MKIYRAPVSTTVSAIPNRNVSIEPGDILVAEIGNTTRYFRGLETGVKCRDCPVHELKIQVESSTLPGCYALDFSCNTQGFEEVNKEAIMEDLI